MDNSTPTGEAPLPPRLHEARDLFARILKALNTAADKLESGEDSKTDATARQDLYRLYVKQLQTVFDIEGSLESHEDKSSPASIDLDDARAEILERIRIIRNGGGD